MPQYFDFSSLVNKYSTEFEATIPGKGDYNDSGKWIESEPQSVKLQGAIISHRESKVFRSSGTLTSQDRALYMLEPLASGLNGAKVIYDNKEFRIGDLLENSAFTGVWAYTLKFVSAFNEGGKDD